MGNVTGVATDYWVGALFAEAELELESMASVVDADEADMTLNDVLSMRLSRAVLSSVCSLLKEAEPQLMEQARFRLAAIDASCDRYCRSLQQRLYTEEPNPVFVAIWES